MLGARPAPTTRFTGSHSQPNSAAKARLSVMSAIATSTAKQAVTVRPVAHGVGSACTPDRAGAPGSGNRPCRPGYRARTGEISGRRGRRGRRGRHLRMTPGIWNPDGLHIPGHRIIVFDRFSFVLRQTGGLHPSSAAQLLAFGLVAMLHDRSRDQRPFLQLAVQVDR